MLLSELESDGTSLKLLHVLLHPFLEYLSQCFRKYCFFKLFLVSFGLARLPFYIPLRIYLALEVDEGEVNGIGARHDVLVVYFVHTLALDDDLLLENESRRPAVASFPYLVVVSPRQLYLL